MFQLGTLPSPPPPSRNPIRDCPVSIDDGLYEEVNDRGPRSLQHGYDIPDEQNSGYASESDSFSNTSRSQENLNQTFEVNDQGRSYENMQMYLNLNEAARCWHNNYDYRNERQGLSHTGNVQVLCIYRKLIIFSNRFLSIAFS